MRLRAVLLLALAMVASCAAEVDRATAFIGYSERARATDGDGAVPCESRDESADCAGWASAGECDRNPGFMRASCAKSCHVPCVARTPRLHDADDPGSAAAAPHGVVIMRTSVGDVRVALRDDMSPVAAAHFRDVARAGTCAGCVFHLAEAIPEPGARDQWGGPGPPYALVQGRLGGGGARSDLPREGSPTVRRGDACVVGGGPDFFIATAAHEEWGHAHTVFGEVSEADMDVVERIVRLPVEHQTWGETRVTALEKKLPFEMAYEEPNAAGSKAGRLRGGGAG